MDALNKAAFEHVTDEAPNLPTGTPVRTVFLGGIFFLMLLAALHTARVIAIPFVLALVLKLVFHPVMRHLERLHIPRTLASVVIIFTLLGIVGGFGAILSNPAADWGAKLPAAIPKLQQRLSFVTAPVKNTQQMLAQADQMANSDGKVRVVAMQGQNLSDKIVGETQAVVGGMFTTLLILLFMLTAGDTFLRRFVEILPRFQDKRQAVDISHEIERDISRYLLTITAMNMGVGILAGLAMALCGVEDPLLWGFLAFILNYIPIIGPFSGIVVFFLVGTMSIANSWMAYAPAGMYVLIHLMEGTFITPMLLARRFTINPVLVITSLIFWYWMWGIPGAILAMPMLAIVKLVCDRIERLAPFGHFLEG